MARMQRRFWFVHRLTLCLRPLVKLLSFLLVRRGKRFMDYAHRSHDFCIPHLFPQPPLLLPISPLIQGAAGAARQALQGLRAQVAQLAQHEGAQDLGALADLCFANPVFVALPIPSVSHGWQCFSCRALLVRPGKRFMNYAHMSHGFCILHAFPQPPLLLPISPSIQGAAGAARQAFQGLRAHVA
jgi:hypothetical protein